MSLNQTPKSQSQAGGLYYAKLRNQKTNKQNLIQQQEEIAPLKKRIDISPIRDNSNHPQKAYLFENYEIDDDNLIYIKQLLQEKEANKAKMTKHKRTQSNINLKKEQVSQLSLTPNQSLDQQLDNESDNLPKLIEQKPVEYAYDVQQAPKLEQKPLLAKQEYGYGEGGDKNQQETDSQNNNFIKAIDGYLDYLNSQGSSSQTSGTEHKVIDTSTLSQNKSDNNITAVLQNENQILKQQLQILDKKYKESSKNCKLLYKEVKQNKETENEAKNMITYQQQEIKNIRKLLSQTDNKLEITREQLTSEKIQHENTRFILKRVLQKGQALQKNQTPQDYQDYQPEKSVNKQKQLQMPQLYDINNLQDENSLQDSDNMDSLTSQLQYDFSDQLYKNELKHSQKEEKQIKKQHKRNQSQNQQNDEQYLQYMINQMIQYQNNQGPYNQKSNIKSSQKNRANDINLRDLQDNYD